MNRNIQYCLLAAYPVIIGFGVFWSSSAVEKTLYDRYIIYNEGIVFESDKIGPSSKFYSKVLNFPEGSKVNNASALGVSSFHISEQQSLHLAYNESPDKSPIVIIRVRNGFKKLHQELIRRLGKESQNLGPDNNLANIKSGEVSDIFKGSLGDQFITRDPSGNRMLFYQKRLRLF